MTVECVIALTTLPADADAAEFARTLVDERLAACVNLLSAMESVYRWEGKIEFEAERQIVIKTSRDRVSDLWDRVRELHPYEVQHRGVLRRLTGQERLGPSERPNTAAEDALEFACLRMRSGGSHRR